MENLDKEVEKECEKNKESKTNNNSCCHKHASSNDAVYGLGLIGAAIFYISNATTFWGVVLGILKAIVWPAFMVYEVLKFLIK